MLTRSIAAWETRAIERDYWMDVYTYLNRYLSDPLYYADSFWDLSCDYIERVYLSLQKTEKDRLQAQSVTTAYLTDTILSLAHSLYGKEGNKYKSQPQVFLPGYEPPTDQENAETHEIGAETIKIFMEEFDQGRIPDFVGIHLANSISIWAGGK